MNLGQLRAELANLIQDSSYSEENLTDRINEAIQYAANVAMLPELKRIGSIALSGSAPYVSLNDLVGGFIGRLRRAVDSSGTPLAIYAS